MGGIIGATSGKFIAMGAALMVQGRVDGYQVTLAIAPAAATSAISTSLAEKLGRSAGRPLQIHIRREYLTAAIDGREAAPAAKADVRLGMDVLGANPTVIDFTQHSMRLIDQHETEAIPRQYYRLKLGIDSGGTATIGLSGPDHAPRAVRFNPGQATGAMPTGACLTDSPGTGAMDSVGLDAFRGQSVIFDFVHQSIWVRKSAKAARLLCVGQGAMAR